MVIAVTSLALHAQGEDEQVLVFRHTGEVNLFYTSLLDSITLSVYDADSIRHDEVVSQVFHSVDTVLVIPIAEIDSVAFGNRNEVQMRQGVRELTAINDLPWMLRFDGVSIFYRLNTPIAVLPKVGERLFYGLDVDGTEDALFPYGLTAKVTSVTMLSDEIRVDVERVALDEIFSRLFFAGRISEQMPTSTKRRAPIHGEIGLDVNLPIPQVGSIGVYDHLTVDGNVVFRLFPRYVSADLDFAFSTGLKIQLEADENRQVNYESFDANYRTIATFYRVLNIGVAVGAFADLNADLSFGMNMERSYHHRIKYERKGDEQNFFTPSVPVEEEYKEEALVHLTLNGSAFFGPIAALQIATVGELLGARIKMKAGPRLESTLSMGMLQNMRTYEPTFYGSAKLDVSARVEIEGFIINRNWMNMNEVDENKMDMFTFDFGQRTLDLFPNYTQTRAVLATTQAVSGVSVATHVENDVVRKVETGFELVNQHDEVVDSIFLDGMVQMESPDVQGFEAIFEMPRQAELTAHSLRVRPVFHYAGHTISAAYANVLHDTHLMPFYAYGSNGAFSFIAGASVVGAFKTNETTYHIGNYLPIPQRDPVFFPTAEGLTTGQFIDGPQKQKLVGTWVGEMEDGFVSLTFNDDDQQTGVLAQGEEERPFTYSLNTPQSGDVRLLFDNQNVLILTVVSVSDTALIVRKKGQAHCSVLLLAVIEGAEWDGSETAVDGS